MELLKNRHQHQTGINRDQRINIDLMAENIFDICILFIR
jgi:hypothetical protein